MLSRMFYVAYKFLFGCLGWFEVSYHECRNIISFIPCELGHVRCACMFCVRMFSMLVCFVCFVCFVCLVLLFVLFMLFVLCVLLTPSFSSIYLLIYLLIYISWKHPCGLGFSMYISLAVCGVCCGVCGRGCVCVWWCGVARRVGGVCVCRGGWVSFVSVLGRVRFVSCVLFSFLLHVYTCISSICISWKVVIYVWGSYFVFVSWKVGKWQFRSWSVMFLVSFRVVVSWRVLWADREVIGVSVAMVFFYVCRCLTPTLTSALRQLWITSIWQQWTLHLTCTKKE